MNNKIEGIVLRQSEYRDSDMILSVFTRENGKMSFLARGIKKAQSKNASSCSLFCHSLFHYNDNGKNGIQTLKTAERKTMFYKIYEDLLRQSVAQVMCECVEKMVDGISEEVYDALYACLLYLHNENDPLLVLSLFLTIANEYCGVTPNVDTCVHCNTQKNIASISLEDGGFVCVQCMDMLHHKKYGEQKLRDFRLVHKAGIEDFEVLKQYVKGEYEMVELLISFFEEYSGSHVKSFAFLKSIINL